MLMAVATVRIFRKRVRPGEYLSNTPVSIEQRSSTSNLLGDHYSATQHKSVQKYRLSRVIHAHASCSYQSGSRRVRAAPQYRMAWAYNLPLRSREQCFLHRRLPLIIEPTEVRLDQTPTAR